MKKLGYLLYNVIQVRGKGMKNIEDIKNIITAKLIAIHKFFTGTATPEHKGVVGSKKLINVILVAFIVFGSFVAMLFLIRGEHSEVKVNEEVLSDHTTIELAESTDKTMKWNNFLEEQIEKEGAERKEAIQLLKESLDDVEAQKQKEANSEFSEIKTRLSFSLNQIEKLQTDNKNILDELDSLNNNNEVTVLPSELGITSIVEHVITRAPVSSYNHLPATSYVSGHLLGGISVSTSVNSALEPIPVVIKLTGKGNLPTNFAVDIKQCRLLASCYGDISSERVIIRAEELVCEDKDEGLLTSTKVAGVIYGDDGANGIRGTVVSMSEKHLKNAAIGGLLSGLSSTGGGQQGLSLTSFGGVSTKSKGAKEMIGEGLLGGASTAAEKLANYHIKLAENISPVILVPGGTKVDIVFTKSVQIGSFDVEEMINSQRGK
jgi:conjugal transfer pilus assembly protein TraB